MMSDNKGLEAVNIHKDFIEFIVNKMNFPEPFNVPVKLYVDDMELLCSQSMLSQKGRALEVANFGYFGDPKYHVFKYPNPEDPSSVGRLMLSIVKVAVSKLPGVKVVCV